ncbi:hypothetical protein ABEW00_02340 [Rossellomorea vietnamensis]|uniref:hypothetical protein n=1 Tax=Rossellomorea vietnamensis TaxID=218284 RepID=UPI003D2AE03A
MAKKKKRKSKKKAFWGLLKEERQELGLAWTQEYKGDENIVKVYSRKFGLNLKNSMKELGSMGVTISNQDKEEVRNTLRKREEEKERKRMKKKARELEDSFDSDDTFAFIAGYTDGGFPFGMTHEKMDEIENEKEMEIK